MSPVCVMHGDELNSWRHWCLNGAVERCCVTLLLLVWIKHILQSQANQSTIGHQPTTASAEHRWAWHREAPALYERTRAWWQLRSCRQLMTVCSTRRRWCCWHRRSATGHTTQRALPWQILVTTSRASQVAQIFLCGSFESSAWFRA